MSLFKTTLNEIEWYCVSQFNLIEIVLICCFLFLCVGVQGGSYLGDVAIDDVLVLSNSQCTIPTTTTTTLGTTTLGRYTPLSCDFEKDLCQWTHDTTAPGYWSRHQGQLNDFHTGPHYGKKTSSILFRKICSQRFLQIIHYKRKTVGILIHQT